MRVTLITLAAAMLLFAGCDEPTGQSTKSAPAAQTATPAKPQKQQTQTTEGKTMVKLETSMGDIVLELDNEKAPITTENFVQYVNDGFYNGTIFHRVIEGFMIQGGGFTSEMQQKPTRAPIQNEASNGLSNNRGTISMARTSDPHSATAQFFINHRDNAPLDYIEGRSDGYAVFGKVVEGMEVVDKIASVQTTRKGPYDDVPSEPVVIESATVLTTE